MTKQLLLLFTLIFTSCETGDRYSDNHEILRNETQRLRRFGIRDILEYNASNAACTPNQRTHNSLLSHSTSHSMSSFQNVPYNFHYLWGQPLYYRRYHETPNPLLLYSSSYINTTEQLMCCFNGPFYSPWNMYINAPINQNNYRMPLDNSFHIRNPMSYYPPSVQAYINDFPNTGVITHDNTTFNQDFNSNLSLKSEEKVDTSNLSNKLPVPKQACGKNKPDLILYSGQIKNKRKYKKKNISSKGFLKISAKVEKVLSHKKWYNIYSKATDEYEVKKKTDEILANFKEHEYLLKTFQTYSNELDSVVKNFLNLRIGRINVKAKEVKYMASRIKIISYAYFLYCLVTEDKYDNKEYLTYFVRLSKYLKRHYGILFNRKKYISYHSVTYYLNEISGQTFLLNI